MALQLVGLTSGAGTGASFSVSLSSLTGGLASSPSPGDIVVVYVGQSNGGTVTSGLSGNNSGAYSTVTAHVVRADTWDSNLDTFYKVQGATPDSTLTVTRADNTTYGCSATVQVWRGVDPTTPLDVTPVPTSAANSCVIDPAAITPTTSGAIIIAGGCGTMPPTSDPFTGFSGMANFVTNKGDGSTSDAGTAMASYAWTSGAYDPPAVSGGTTNNSSAWTAVTMALRPFVIPEDSTLLSATGEVIAIGSKAASGSADLSTVASIEVDSGRFKSDDAVLSATGAVVANSFKHSYASPVLTAAAEVTDDGVKCASNSIHAIVVELSLPEGLELTYELEMTLAHLIIAEGSKLAQSDSLLDAVLDNSSSGLKTSQESAVVSAVADSVISGGKVSQDTAVLEAVAEVTVSGERVEAGAASTLLSAASSIITTGAKVGEDSASLSAVASVIATGEDATGVVPSSSTTLSAVADSVTSGSKIVSTTTSVSATSDLIDAGSKLASDSAYLSAVATLVVSGVSVDTTRIIIETFETLSTITYRYDTLSSVVAVNDILSTTTLEYDAPSVVVVVNDGLSTITVVKDFVSKLRGL